MHHEHYLTCNAPICQADPNPNYKEEVIWYPSEQICKKAPFEKFQVKQIEINELLRESRFQNMDHVYTANELENGSI